MNSFIARFAFATLRQNLAKHSVIFLLFSTLVALIFSSFMLSQIVQSEINKTIEPQADLVVQRIKGGRITTMDENRASTISKISGIERAIPRVWGYYNFENAGKSLTIVGLNLLDDETSLKLQTLTESLDIAEFLDEPKAVVGAGVKALADEFFFGDFFPFYSDDGELVSAKIAGVFDTATALETNELVLIGTEFARLILNYDQEEITDIALFVPNKTEIPVIARKIRELYPDTKVIQKTDIEALYGQLYDIKSGFFLVLFTTVMISFFILLFYKSSALSPHEKREIGVLRAIGWSINSIVIWKVIESSFVAVSSFLCGFILAIFYLIVLKAPFLIDFFVGSENLELQLDLSPELSFYLFLQVFLFVVPPFVAATLLPAWRAATEDTHEVLR